MQTMMHHVNTMQLKLYMKVHAHWCALYTLPHTHAKMYVLGLWIYDFHMMYHLEELAMGPSIRYEYIVKQCNLKHTRMTCIDVSRHTNMTGISTSTSKRARKGERLEDYYVCARDSGGKKQEKPAYPRCPSACLHSCLLYTYHHRH